MVPAPYPGGRPPGRTDGLCPLGIPILALLALVGQAGMGSVLASSAEVEAVSNGKGDVAEYSLKAAFLYNFIRFTTWPKERFENESSPIVLMVVGKDPFGEILDETFAGKKVGGRRVELRRVAKLPKEPDCHLLFVTGMNAKDRRALLERCRSRSILVVGEDEGFGEEGACANFYVEKNKVRFEINPDEVKAQKLTISSELLKLAKIVRTKEKDE